MGFPTTRLRRLRRSEAVRALVRETRLDPGDFILPAFVVHGRGIRQEIGSMPGCHRVSVDALLEDAAAARDLGVAGVILFGIPDRKDAAGSEAYSAGGAVQEAARALKKSTPELVVITDVCLCEYTDHGHCGVLKGDTVDNDATLDLLARTAVSQAEAGADVVAPSDMMDGRVGAIRRGLDERGFTDTLILSYAAKYASAFYGPFRVAADSAPSFGDRKSYQMDPANSDEALREVELDIQEGADMVMVKPALAYLDVVHRVKQKFGLPLAAYNVSGEYLMVESAARSGYVDKQRLMLEILTSIKRAGADFIITYHALEAARLLKG